MSGVRMLDGPISDSVEAAALSLNQQHIDIYSASWGPDDDGVTVDGPGRLVKTAFAQGITTVSLQIRYNRSNQSRHTHQITGACEPGNSQQHIRSALAEHYRKPLVYLPIKPMFDENVSGSCRPRQHLHLGIRQRGCKGGCLLLWWIQHCYWDAEVQL